MAEQRSGFLTRLRTGLARAREGWISRLQGLVAGRRSVDEELLEELEQILIEADVGVETTLRLLDRVRDGVRTGTVRSAEQVPQVLREEMERILSGPGVTDGMMSPRREPGGPPPHVVLIVGVNGAGKTTTIGKLASWYRSQGERVVIAAADTFRAAAIEQLAVWAERAEADLVRQDQGSDPAAVVYDAVQAARARHADRLLVDTAGRLQTKVNLMEELRKVRRVIERELSGQPEEVLLVLDATTGQNGLQQASAFLESVGVTGVVLTKLDGTARGGIVLAIRERLGLPVCYVGVGEGVEDLRPFDSGEFLEALFSPR